MKVIIRFAHAISRIFYNVSNEDIEILKKWMKSYSYPSTTILEFTNENKTYYLNRDLVADMVILNMEVIDSANNE